MWGSIKNPVAYFSAEFGIDNDLPTYSGGLGILAGDVISAAADSDTPFIGVGILYKGKNFIQHITSEGKSETRDSEFDHDSSFLRQTQVNGKPAVVEIALGEQKVLAKSYHIRLAEQTVLFFLSTDLDTNPPEWVSDMDTLYGGDTDSQIRQQILLGVGGIKLIRLLGISPKKYHINEGRAAFIIWELAKRLSMEKKIDFKKAWGEETSKIVYTNHTLVSAGNLVYPYESVKYWASLFSKDMNIDPNYLVEGGLTAQNDFSITQFALKCSSKHSAVSTVHCDSAKTTWPDFNWTAITNGVHLPRWQDSDFRKNMSDEELWQLHLKKKSELAQVVVQRTGIGYDPQRLIITWARRLAAYKQPKLIFSDIKRLINIVKKENMPVQILFSGNSHSGDTRSNPIIEEVIKLFSSELSGHAIFVPNYNIALANHLVSGSDIWLNTPQGNLEACGTSGMKAAINGVVNMTVLDGWTYEVDWKGRGFVLDAKNTAESFYHTLEKSAQPLFYELEAGIPKKWIDMMRNSIALSGKFSAQRVLEDYKKNLYLT